jgi:tetratricopeptide (TPR) repeat protein
MAEGALGELLGEDAEKAEVEAGERTPSAEAYAAAVASGMTVDPEVARQTVAFLASQTALLDVQRAHIEHEHTLRLASLRNQISEQGLRRFGLRLRTISQLLIALIIAALVLGLAVMVYDAFHSRSVVIDSFETPPALAAQGVNGRVLASGLLDVLTEIQTATRSSADHPSLLTAWSNDISIEIPETSLSIQELERALKARFGHDQHIEGDLIQTTEGAYALTVRGTGIQPKTFTGGDRDLDQLTRAAGEYLYGQSQPGLWAWYLGDRGRAAEAIAFSREMYPKAAPVEKPYVLNAWGNAIVYVGEPGACARALELYREALRLKPDYLVAQYNVMQMLTNLGREEEVIGVGDAMLKQTGGRPGRGDENLYQYWDTAVYNLQALRAGFISDMEAHGGLGSVTASNGAESLSVAFVDVLLHDLHDAQLRLSTVAVDPGSAPDMAARALAAAMLANARGDAQEAARQMEAMQAQYAVPSVWQSSTALLCFAAPIYESAGLPAKADAVFASMGPLTFLDCTRFKADILDARGDWQGARQWYARAIKLAPSLPAGYYSWALAASRHNDLPHALELLEAANKRGPHWADPLKAWGDVLLKMGRRAEAHKKYEDALRFAPEWAELKSLAAGT